MYRQIARQLWENIEASWGSSHLALAGYCPSCVKYVYSVIYG